MSTVINKATLELRESCNTPDYSETEWIIDPDLSTVQGLAKKYWKVFEGTVQAMTEEEKAVIDAAELLAYKASIINRLWQSFYDYNFQFYSGGIYTQILELKLMGSTKAVDCQDWVLALWRDYYTRKYYVGIATTKKEVDAISLDASNNGVPPWTVSQILADVPPDVSPSSSP